MPNKILNVCALMFLNWNNFPSLSILWLRLLARGWGTFHSHEINQYQNKIKIKLHPTYVLIQEAVSLRYT